MRERVPIWGNPDRPELQFARRPDGQWFCRRRMSRYLWTRWEMTDRCDAAAGISAGAGTARLPCDSDLASRSPPSGYAAAQLDGLPIAVGAVLPQRRHPEHG